MYEREGRHGYTAEGSRNHNYVVVVVFLEILECMTWSPFGDWEAGFLGWR